MGSKLLGLLGFDDDDPRVAAGRRHGSIIARLIDTLVGERERLGLRQVDVAKRMETTQSAVSNFENAGGDPKMSTVLRYADAIGVEVRPVVFIRGENAPTQIKPKSARAGVPSRYRTPRFEVAFN